jgi:hypothetical protein
MFLKLQLNFYQTKNTLKTKTFQNQKLDNNASLPFFSPINSKTLSWFCNYILCFFLQHDTKYQFQNL